MDLSGKASCCDKRFQSQWLNSVDLLLALFRAATVNSYSSTKCLYYLLGPKQPPWILCIQPGGREKNLRKADIFKDLQDLSGVCLRRAIISVIRTGIECFLTPHFSTVILLSSDSFLPFFVWMHPRLSLKPCWEP